MVTLHPALWLHRSHLWSVEMLRNLRSTSNAASVVLWWIYAIKWGLSKGESDDIGWLIILNYSMFKQTQTYEDCHQIQINLYKVNTKHEDKSRRYYVGSFYVYVHIKKQKKTKNAATHLFLEFLKIFVYVLSCFFIFAEACCKKKNGYTFVGQITKIVGHSIF